MGNCRKSGNKPKKSTDLCEVIPGKLYISSVLCADPRFLQKEQIGQCISVIPELPASLKNSSRGIQVRHIPIHDNGDAKIGEHFENAIYWIHSFNGKTLVHCSAGRSRSATIIIAYLVAKKNLSVRDAYRLLKSKRKIIGPNTGFIQRLLEFEDRLIEREERKRNENSKGKRTRSLNFLAEYVIDTKMGGAKKMKALLGVTVDKFQAIIDECNGNVAKAQLKVISDAKPQA